MKRHLSFVAALGLCFFASITAAYAQVRADPGGIAIGGSVTGSTVIIGIPQEKVDSEIEVTRTHFAYHIYTSTAESVVENVAGAR
jgi:hypothetical protein